MLLKLLLTGAEIAAQNSGVECNLYDLAKRYGRTNKNFHSNAVRSFETMVSNLTPANHQLLAYEESSFTTETGNGTVKTFKTYNMDIKTAVWFASKYEDNLRFEIINYAFSKLEEDYKKAKQREELLKDELTKRPVTVKLTNTNTASRKARHEELMDWVEKGWLEHTVKTIKKHSYEITEEGLDVGLTKDFNGKIYFE